MKRPIEFVQAIKNTDRITALKRLLFFATMISTFTYLFWRMFFTLPIHYGVASLVAGVLMLVSEILSTLQALDKFSNIKSIAEPELPVIPESWFPHVDVFIATHNESTDILFKTVNGCTFMDYPDKKKIHVYICDDNNRPEMAALARELKVGYFGLTGNKLLKAGNLNNAMRQTDSPLVVTFDADMIPTRNMLTKTVPYFFLPNVKKLPDGTWVEREPEEIDPNFKIGFIQTPQSFYNPDLFQFNLYSEGRIPNEQDYFFREINVIRNAANAAIYAGSNTVISRKALEEVDYIATGTITEDFATGIKIQRKGWTTYATATPLAHGLAPDDIESLIKQRERWGRGCVQSLQNMNIVLMKDMPITAKLSYINCYFYWWSFLARLVFIMAPILFAVFHLRVLICTVEQFFIFWIPYFVLYSLTTKLTSGATRNQHWNGVIDTIMFPYLSGPILLEALGFKLKKFAVTRKDRLTEKKPPTIIYALPHFFLLFASFLALIICIQLTLQSAMMHNIVMMYWLVINSKNLILAIFFMMGRENIRETERFYVELPVELRTGWSTVSAKTADISEDGMALILDRPEYFDPEKDFDLTITGAPYEARMRVRVLHINKRKDNTWKYSINISHIDQPNVRQYYQIIYDRHHSLPDKIADSWSLFDDYQIQLSKRQESQINAQRKFPRIDLNISAQTKDGKECVIRSFNYRYMSFKFLDSMEEAGEKGAPAAGKNSVKPFGSAEVVFDVRQDLTFRLRYEYLLPNGVEHLYRLTNWDKLLVEEGYSDLINDLVSGKVLSASIAHVRSIPEKDRSPLPEVLAPGPVLAT
ncbi:MAG: glycosyltransferase [Treponema sp.]|jgi:cellulose synthase (UDP-forming)|nr:glycosyltransferase [Treponema sp.]